MNINKFNPRQELTQLVEDFCKNQELETKCNHIFEPLIEQYFLTYPCSDWKKEEIEAERFSVKSNIQNIINCRNQEIVERLKDILNL